MPNYFQLTRIGKTKAETFVTIDAEICAILDIEVHPTKYAFSWYDAYGLRYSLGHTNEQIKEEFIKLQEEAIRDYPAESHEEINQYFGVMFKILNYLRRNYTTNAWYSTIKM